MAGIAVRRLSRGEYCASAPYHAIANRKLEYAIVAQKFPSLASLPLDRGTRDQRSLRAEMERSRLPRRLQYWLTVMRRVFENRPRKRRVEQRFHVRQFDMNSETWRDAREAIAESFPLRTRSTQIERVPCWVRQTAAYAGRAWVLGAGSRCP